MKKDDIPLVPYELPSPEIQELIRAIEEMVARVHAEFVIDAKKLRAFTTARRRS